MVEEPAHDDEQDELPDEADYDDEFSETSAEDPTTPNVVRKRHGRYDAAASDEPRPDEEPEARDGEGMDAAAREAFSGSSNGSEERPRVRRRRKDPTTGEGEPFSEVPEDLFQWPEAWKSSDRASARAAPKARSPAKTRTTANASSSEPA